MWIPLVEFGAQCGICTGIRGGNCWKKCFFTIFNSFPFKMICEGFTSVCLRNNKKYQIVHHFRRSTLKIEWWMQKKDEKQYEKIFECWIRGSIRPLFHHMNDVFARRRPYVTAMLLLFLHPVSSWIYYSKLWKWSMAHRVFHVSHLYIRYLYSCLRWPPPDSSPICRLDETRKYHSNSHIIITDGYKVWALALRCFGLIFSNIGPCLPSHPILSNGYVFDRKKRKKFSVDINKFIYEFIWKKKDTYNASCIIFRL